MALKTQIFSYGDYAYQSYSNAYVLELTLTENSVSDTENTSSVSYVLKLKSGIQNRFSMFSIGATVTLDGAVVGSRDRYNEPQVSLDYSSEVTLISGTTTIEHDADGSKTMSVAFAIDMATSTYSPGPINVTDESMTLTVITIKTYTVTFNANGGKGAPSAQSKVHGRALTLSSTEPTKDPTYANREFVITGNCNGGNANTSVTATRTTPTTYDFLAWNTKPDGTGTTYTPGESYRGNADLALYAIWEAKAGSPTYSNNTLADLPIPVRDDGSIQMKAVFEENGGEEVADITANAPVSFGFNGWNSKGNGTGTSYSDNSAFYAATTVYAQWEEHYDYPSIELPIPKKSGEQFLYWVTDELSGITGECTLTQAVTTFYAVYEALGKIWIYCNGAMRTGILYVWHNGKLTRAKGLYVRKNGQWKISK